jgi:hypothetical protein
VTYYVPGLGEKDPDKTIRSLMQAHEKTATNTADIATNTADIAALEAQLPVAIGDVTGLGTGVATFLGTPSSANLRSALTDETGTGAAVFATSPTIATPSITGRTPTTATVTISNGSPGEVTWTANGLPVNAPVFFATTGALPTGLTAAVKSTGSQISPNTYQSNPTLYYLKTIVTADKFTVSATPGGAAINTSSAGSGTHTAFANAMVPTGNVGEMIYKTIEISPGVAATSGTEATWISMDVTSGIWLVGGVYGIYGDSGTPTFTDWHATVGYSVSGGFLTITSPYGGITAAHISTNQSNGLVLPFAQQPIFLTSNTTLSSAAKVNWTGGGTALHYGGLWALRIG